MRKQITLVLLLLTTIMFSQVTVQPGIRSGVNIAKINGVKGEGKVDFYVGATLSVNLGNFYTLQPEFIYTKQGGHNIYKQERQYNNTTNEYNYVDTYKDFDSGYLSIGLANKFYVTQNRDFHLLVAPSLDILVEENNSNYNLRGNGYYVEENNITGIDLAMAFGLGYEFPFGLGIDARYKMGVVNVLDDVFSGASTRNRVFQAGLTYRFFSNK